jgi:hypothetical protein
VKLPDPNSPGEIFKFAMSFDAYSHFGSFSAAADVARRAPRTTLEEIRAELFVKARAARHADSDLHVTTYRELLPFFERYSKKEE